MNTISNLASELAGRDIATAFSFLDSIDFKDERRRALRSMGRQLARHHLSEAVQIVGASDDSELQRQLAGPLTAEWSKYDRENTLAWAQGLEDASARRNALRPILQNWLQTDPRGAFDYIGASEEGSALGSLSNAFRQWAREDPKAATEALALLPESAENQRENIYGPVAHSYVQHDPMAASEWIATLDKGPARDRSVETLVNQIVDAEPDSAFFWAVTIDNPDKRTKGLQRAALKWAQTDRKKVLEAIEDASIEAKEKESILSFLGK